MSRCLHEPPGVPVLPAKATTCEWKDSWRWQTSNSEYGKFYPSMRREFAKSQEVHKDCSKKCEDLGDQLKLAECQLEKLKISCGRSLSDSVGKQDRSCSPLPRSPKLGGCSCPGQPGPPSSDMYVTEMMNQYNGARRHDPQMLLDHIRDDHPHLVNRVGPKLPSSAGRNYEGADACAGCCPGKKCCGAGLRSKSGSQSPRAGKGRGGCGKRKAPKAGRLASKKPKVAIYEPVSDLRRTAAGGANLPPTQRYDFYRYYGYAGQGARTSKDWRSVKIPWFRTPRY